MSVAVGMNLGPYEILSPLGAGGMGEVYRARDTKLNRDVAIKVLPGVFASDADRLVRFTREAQTLAALNHPNIATIYGIEEIAPSTGSAGSPQARSRQAGGRALVMELVEGDDLSAVIARGPMPSAEVLPIARQIAEALEAAHEQGIVHRDLKPANIKVRHDGAVKVLDFGLAKPMAGLTGSNRVRDGSVGQPVLPAETLVPAPGAHLENSPTMVSPAMTVMGTILGTAAYMSPEQARGRTVDKRSDVWAFGCVLYEMLTGTPAFDGRDTTEIISAIVKTEPDWSAFPAGTLPHLRTIVERCLVKERRTRIPDFSVVRFMLDGSIGAAAPPAATPAPGRGSARIWKAASLILLLTTIGGVAGWYRQRSAAPAVVRFEVLAPADTRFAAGVRRAAMAAISPDGRTLAFTATDGTGKSQLWVRSIDSLAAQPLAGTDGGVFPFWSPDSSTIGYAIPGKLMKIAATGGPAQTLCPLSGATIVSRGAAWNHAGVIVFNNGQGPLFRVSAAGGQATAIGQLEAGETGRQFPSFLPDGDHVLYFATATLQAVGGLYVASLATGDSKRLLGTDTSGVYAPRGGYLLFGRQGTLLAQSFDPKALALAGEPFPIAEHVETAAVPGVAAFSLSDTGVLAYGVGAPADAGFNLAWVDRQGKAAGTAGPPGQYRGVDLSPDGGRVAAHRHDGEGGDIWLMDVSRGTTSRFTFDASQDNSSPTWSRDGSRIAFASMRNGKWGLYAKPSNSAGNEERLFESEAAGVLAIEPMSWAPDGRALLFAVFDRKTQWDLWLLSLSGERKAVSLLQASTFERHGQISPDGRWLAYMSRETGANEICVQAVPPASGKWSVSTGGGTVPRWRGDSRELFYLAGGKMMAVDVQPDGAVFQSGTPKALFEYGNSNITHADYFPYAVTKDGQRFLITRELPSAASDARQDPVVVVLNWTEGLRR